MRQGRDLEEYVAERFCEETGKKVRRTNFMYSNKQYPFMIANVDRLVVGENAGLECKTASAYSEDQWTNGNIPAHYVIQCNHYMAVTGAQRWYLAVVVLGRAFHFVCIERDQSTINALIEIEKSFWYDNISKGIPPSPDGSEATEAFLRTHYNTAQSGKSIQLSGFDEELQRHKELIELISKLEVEKRTIEEQIKISMDDAETAYTDNYVISWKLFEQDRLDTKRLKDENPELYNEYKKKISSRRFVIKVA
jgi:predicted phage-related endonuclease